MIEIWNLLQIAKKYKNLNNEIILLYLYAKKYCIPENDATFVIDEIYNIYVASNNKEKQINILFYEIYNNNETCMLIENYKLYKDEELLELLIVSSSNISFKIKLVKEAEKRKILNCEIVEQLLWSTWPFGAFAILSIIESFDFAKFNNENVKINLEKQLQFLNHTKNYQLINKLKKYVGK